MPVRATGVRLRSDGCGVTGCPAKSRKRHRHYGFIERGWLRFIIGTISPDQHEPGGRLQSWGDFLRQIQPLVQRARHDNRQVDRPLSRPGRRTKTSLNPRLSPAIVPRKPDAHSGIEGRKKVSRRCSVWKHDAEKLTQRRAGRSTDDRSCPPNETSRGCPRLA